MNKFIKNNIILVIGIIIGILTISNSIVLAYSFAASEIRHVKSDNSETSVELALNELYQMYDADNIILSKIYPVGSYYISNSNTNPGTIFGGTWHQITDTMLIAAGSTFNTVNVNSYTKDSGNTSVTLAANQIPTLTGISGSTTSGEGSHTHTYVHVPQDSSSDLRIPAGSSYSYGNLKSYTITGGAHTHTFTNGTYTNSNQQSVNIMNPYKVVYMWVRTA